MKKFFAIFAIASVMVACNNAAETTTEPVATEEVAPATEEVVADSTAVETPATEEAAPAAEAPAAH
jgi:hypothetical protein